MEVSNHKPEDLISEVHNFDGYFIFRRKDGIVHIQFEAGFVGDIEDAKMQVSIFKKLSAPRKAVILAVYEDDNSFTKEAREFVAGSEVCGIVQADAFVIRGMALRILASGYLKINRPGRPTKIFGTPAAAVAWLKQFIE